MPKPPDVSSHQRRALATFVAFMRAYESVRARLEPQLAQLGVTPTQWGALEALYHVGPLKQRDLARKILTSAPNLTTVINNLERDGLVVREAVPLDRRQKLVRLTRAGAAVVRKVFPVQAEAIERQFRALTADEQEQLRSLCRKLGQHDERTPKT